MAEGDIIRQKTVYSLIPVYRKELSRRAYSFVQYVKVYEYAAEEGHTEGQDVDDGADQFFPSYQRTGQECQG